MSGPSVLAEDNEDFSEKNHYAQEEGLDVTKIDKELVDQLSTEEQEWYNKFQNGLMFFSGWKEISEEILTCLPMKDRPEAQRLLETLGIRIGTEWSKDNTARKIDTDQLQAWGDRLRKARKSGAQQLADTVTRITTEVNDILNPGLNENIASDSL